MLVAETNDDGTESIQFYQYDQNLGIFANRPYALIEDFPTGIKIKNLIANDINSDGNLDLIVTLYNQSDKSTNTQVFFYDSTLMKFKLVVTVEGSGVFVGDFNGDRT